MDEKGIFRRAGLESRMQALREALTEVPGKTDFTPYKMHDVSSVMKRFLRELPEPLFTFPLHDLFLISQKFPEPEVQTEVIHLVLLLLPRCNRDLVEVIVLFLRKLADKAVGQEEQEGNLMTSRNLATVFAPTVLYSEKERDKQKEAVSHGHARKNSAGSIASIASIASISSLAHRKESSHNLAKILTENEELNDRSVSVLATLIDNASKFSQVPSLILTQLSKPVQFAGTSK